MGLNLKTVWEKRHAYKRSYQLVFLLFFVSLLSCSSRPTRPTSKRPSVQKITINPGKVALIEILADNDLDNQILKCDGNVIPFYTSNNRLRAFLSESYFAKEREYKCVFIANKKQKVIVSDVAVKKFDYKTEKLSVNKKKVVLSKKDLSRVVKERKVLSKIYRRSSRVPLFKEKFEAPLNSFITSHYGVKRIFNNLKKTQHLGNDFRAKIGVPIKVSNRGRVVFAGDLFFGGKVVIVDHGLGVFTTYGHLSKIKVGVGDIVPKKSVIGLSGATGRVTGPHLHWGVKVHGHWVDGFSLNKAGI